MDFVDIVDIFEKRYCLLGFTRFQAIKYPQRFFPFLGFPSVDIVDNYLQTGVLPALSPSVSYGVINTSVDVQFS